MSRQIGIIIIALVAAFVAGGAVFLSLIGKGNEKWESVMAAPQDEDEPLTIRVLARQSFWTIWYPGPDGLFGATNPEAISAQNLAGLEPSDAHAQDDILSTEEFHLPVGREVDLRIRSLDVLHSLYMPHFRVKVDAVPGMETHWRFTPTITTEDKRKDTAIVRLMAKSNEGKPESEWKEFDFELACTEVCGKDHFKMRMPVVVSNWPEYKAWLSEQVPVGKLLMEK